MIRPPKGLGASEFVVLARLRVVQLNRGCTPRIEGDYRATTMAQLEIGAGKVTRAGEHGEAISLAVSPVSCPGTRESIVR